MVDQPDIRDTFDEVFMKWARAVVKYSKETQVNSSAIQLILGATAEDCDAGMLAVLYILPILNVCSCLIINNTNCLHFRDMCCDCTALYGCPPCANQDEESGW